MHSTALVLRAIQIAVHVRRGGVAVAGAGASAADAEVAMRRARPAVVRVRVRARREAATAPSATPPAARTPVARVAIGVGVHDLDKARHPIPGSAAQNLQRVDAGRYSPSLDYWRRVKLKREFARKRVLTEATWFQQNASFAACEALHSDSELYAKRGTRFYEQLPTRRMSNGEQWP